MHRLHFFLPSRAYNLRVEESIPGNNVGECFLMEEDEIITHVRPNLLIGLDDGCRSLGNCPVELPTKQSLFNIPPSDCQIPPRFADATALLHLPP